MFKGMTDAQGRPYKEIKLCYVTVRPSASTRTLESFTIILTYKIAQPEMVAQSDRFMSVLETLAERNRLGMPMSLHLVPRD